MGPVGGSKCSLCFMSFRRDRSQHPRSIFIGALKKVFFHHNLSCVQHSSGPITLSISFIKIITLISLRLSSLHDKFGSFWMLIPTFSPVTICPSYLRFIRRHAESIPQHPACSSESASPSSLREISTSSVVRMHVRVCRP
jgi:hypothetical protein